MYEFLAVWVIVSIPLGVITLVSFTKDTDDYWKIKHIVCGILFFPMTLCLAIVLLVIYICDNVPNLGIAKKISRFMNKKVW